jgi:hypothetical protein
MRSLVMQTAQKRRTNRMNVSGKEMCWVTLGQPALQSGLVQSSTTSPSISSKCRAFAVNALDLRSMHERQSSLRIHRFACLHAARTPVARYTHRRLLHPKPGSQQCRRTPRRGEQASSRSGLLATPKRNSPRTTAEMQHSSTLTHWRRATTFGCLRIAWLTIFESRLCQLNAYQTPRPLPY